jgi:hypothetical protein
VRQTNGKWRASWTVVSTSVLTGLLVAPPPACAQKCSDRDPQLAVGVLEEVLRSCSSHDAFEAVGYKYGYDVIAKAAAVGGERTIPVLREIAKSPRSSDCFWGRAREARQALTKLGDEARRMFAIGSSRASGTSLGVTVSSIYRWQTTLARAFWSGRVGSNPIKGGLSANRCTSTFRTPTFSVWLGKSNGDIRMPSWISPHSAAKLPHRS